MATETKPPTTTQTVTVPLLPPEAEAAEAVIRKGIEAFNAGDLKTYLALFTDDVESYTGIVTPLRFEGLPAWKAFVEEIRKGATARYEPRQASIRAYNEDTVISNHYFVFTGEASDGTREMQTGRASLVCVKQGGTWLIANQHYSPMF